MSCRLFTYTSERKTLENADLLLLISNSLEHLKFKNFIFFSHKILHNKQFSSNNTHEICSSFFHGKHISLYFFIFLSSFVYNFSSQVKSNLICHYWKVAHTTHRLNRANKLCWLCMRSGKFPKNIQFLHTYYYHYKQICIRFLYILFIFYNVIADMPDWLCLKWCAFLEWGKAGVQISTAFIGPWKWELTPAITTILSSAHIRKRRNII